MPLFSKTHETLPSVTTVAWPIAAKVSSKIAPTSRGTPPFRGLDDRGASTFRGDRDNPPPPPVGRLWRRATVYRDRDRLCAVRHPVRHQLAVADMRTLEPS